MAAQATTPPTTTRLTPAPASKRYCRRIHMRSRIVIVAGLIAFVISVQSVRAVPRDAFIGTWKVTVIPQDEARKAGEKEFKDALVFRGALFKSTELAKKGFKEA